MYRDIKLLSIPSQPCATVTLQTDQQRNMATINLLVPSKQSSNKRNVGRWVALLLILGPEQATQPQAAQKLVDAESAKKPIDQSTEAERAEQAAD